MLSLVSTWMGDRLGTLGAVGHKLFFFFFLFWFLFEFATSKILRVVKVVKSRQGRRSRQSHQSWNQLALLIRSLKATQTVSHPSLHIKVQ